ncbi:30S ribosomal protein S5 [Patescibacteria group bacterium]|nr:30S ribosomal protein S5 [Patescibacteria group bacterium]
MPGKPFFKQKKVSEFQEKVLEIRRVTRVVAGGKRFSFRATVVLGDRKGRVGVGVAKGMDVAGSIEKAKRAAERAMLTVPLKEGRTIPHDVDAKYSAAKVRLKPAVQGHGLIAGGSVRAVLEVAGVKDISAKILGRTTNKLTNALATIEALKKLMTVK